MSKDTTTPHGAKRTVTLDDIMSFDPCLLEAEIKQLMRGATSVSMRDIALAAHVEEEGRLWLLLNMLTAQEQHEAACRFAEVALWHERKAGREPDPRSWAAINAKRAWLRGEIPIHQLRMAMNAAWAAVWTANKCETCIAASDAACIAAIDAAWIAAIDTAWIAAGGAAGGVVRRHQIEIICDLVGAQL